MKSPSVHPLVATAFVLVLATSVFAQTFTGGLRGAVRDNTGVVPGVTVTLINEATNTAREVVTNDAGEFNFPALPPATYMLRTRITGYKTYEQTGIRVGTQQFITLDVMLEVGAIEESITVTGETPLLETSNASTGGVLDRQALEMLPAPGRNAFLIGVTIPTFNPVGDPQFNRQQDQTNASRVSLGGGGIRANNYLIDGVPFAAMDGRAVLNPIIEAVEEIKVQVHTYDGEMGRTGGGVFNVTAKSGANSFHGTGFYQTRPVAGQALNFFDKEAGRTKEETGVSESYYRLYGGGIGGPVLRNRTFFWTAAEGYRSFTTRALNYIWPSLKQRNGDFSTSTIGEGGPAVRIFNPYCRGGVVTASCPATGSGSLATGGEFTNAIIPRGHPAASAVGFNLINAWPTKTVSGRDIDPREDNNANATDTARLVDAADMFTIKIEHKFTDRWSLSGLYIYNKTDEPGSGIMPADFVHIENQDEFFTTLRRRPQVLVFNNTNVINDSTVLALRFGWSTWQDQTDRATFDGGMAGLGFRSAFVNALAEKDVFPELSFDDVGDVGGWGGSRRRWNQPFAFNGVLSKLFGSHSVKVGADARQLGITTTTVGSITGGFTFNRLFTSSPGVSGSGHELASMLLGAPAGGSAPFNRGQGKWFTRYYGVFVQDDWRVSSKFTLNYGLRFEHEDGLREINNRQTVGFDRDVVSPLDALVPKAGTLLQGRTIKGGLIFAGVDGAPEEQGDPSAIKVSPRIGANYALNNQTVIRGGYGLFYAPWQYSCCTHGQGPWARTTSLGQSSGEREVPLTTLDNPFPAGLQEPFGSSLGLLTQTGGTVEFVDQTKGAPKVHQYSVDVQRELPGNMAVIIGYTGAAGRDAGFGGTVNTAININQIDPDVARQVFPAPGGGWDAAALRRSVPNPFFRVPGTGEFGTRPTIQAGQLLRPFPQFGDIDMFEMTKGGRRQYHAAIFQIDKRLTGWWGGRYSYTWSRTEDNQFGESSTYGTRTSTPQNNYDLDAEYGISFFDSPHRIILAPVVRVPGPQRGAAATVLGGWTASAIIELVSGSPLNAVMTSGTSSANLGLFGGRQRPNLAGDPNTSGSDRDRVATNANPNTRYFNAAAFQNPGAGTYGNAPRTIADARYQFRNNLDLSFAKDFRFKTTQTAQLRFEVLNLTNTPKFGGIASNAVNSTSFGRIDTQRGFSRIWQLSFRYKF